MNRIFCPIVCPGVVFPTGNTEVETVLKGIVRVENLKAPMDFIPAVLERVKPEYIKKTYMVDDWKDTEDFLEQVARRAGRLFKKCEADVQTVARNILNDFQRGKLPYFVKPADSEGGGDKNAELGVSQSFKDHPTNDVFDESDAKNAGGDEESDSNEAEIGVEEIFVEDAAQLTETDSSSAVVVEDQADIIQSELNDAAESAMPMDTDVDDLAVARLRRFDGDEDSTAEKQMTGRQRRKQEPKQRVKKFRSAPVLAANSHPATSTPSQA